MSIAYTTRELKKWDVYYIEYRDEYGNGKIGRPGIIVSPDRRNASTSYDVSVVFLTTSPQSGNWNPVITSTGRKSYAVCGDITRVARSLLGSYCATLTASEIKGVEQGLLDYLELNDAEDQLAIERLKTEELEQKIAELEKKLAESAAAIEEKAIDCEMYKRGYDKVMDRLVDQRIEMDLAKRPVADVIPEAPEVPEEPEAPEEVSGKVDINRCTERDLLGLGFPFSVARNITAARPFLKEDDLRIVPGVTRIAYQLVEKRITVGDISEYLHKKVEPPVEEKLDLNTVTPQQLQELVGLTRTEAYRITGWRNKYGPYKTWEELAAGPRIFKTTLAKMEGKVEI